jgi:hypothetical protein
VLEAVTPWARRQSAVCAGPCVIFRSNGLLPAIAASMAGAPTCHADDVRRERLVAVHRCRAELVQAAGGLGAGEQICGEAAQCDHGGRAADADADADEELVALHRVLLVSVIPWPVGRQDRWLGPSTIRLIPLPGV